MREVGEAAGRYINRLAGYIGKNLDSFAAKQGITPAEGRTLQYIAAQKRDLCQKGMDVLGFGLGARTRFDGALTVNTTQLPLYLAHSGEYAQITAQAQQLGTD